MKKIFVICPVTIASDRDKKEIGDYVESLKENGFDVHYPMIDTPQDETKLNINRINTRKIQKSDEVHIFYKRKSQGIHFDMGNIFSLKMLHENKILSFFLRIFGIKNPRVVLVKNQPNINDSGYTELLEQWLPPKKEDNDE